MVIEMKKLVSRSWKKNKPALLCQNKLRSILDNEIERFFYFVNFTLIFFEKY